MLRIHVFKLTASRCFFPHFDTSVILIRMFVSGQQYSEEFGKISIMRKVPVMKDGSFILTERYNGGVSTIDFKRLLS